MSVIGDQGSTFFKHLTPNAHDADPLGSYPGFIGFIAVLILPLIMFRSYGDLAVISLASLGFIVFIVIFVLVKGQLNSVGFAIAPTYVL